LEEAMKKMRSMRVAVVVVALLVVGSLTLAGSPGSRKALRAERSESMSLDRSHQQNVDEERNQNDQSYQPVSAGYRIRIVRSVCSSESRLPSMLGVFGGPDVVLMSKVCSQPPRK
jgi:hypothetical protein